MTVKCTTEKELGKAIKEKQDEIIVEGDLKNKVIRIKATGKVAWAVCAISLAVAIKFYIATPTATVTATPIGGTLCLIGGVTMSAPVVASLGSAIVPAVIIGVTAGGIGALNTLRDQYKITKSDKSSILLKRKRK